MPTAPAPTTAAPTTPPPTNPGFRNISGNIISELSRPVRLYDEAAFAANTLAELGISTPLTVIERDRGWYRVDVGGVEGWVFGAYVLPTPNGFTNYISVDGSLIRPTTLDGDPIAGAYRGGKYAFGRDSAVDGRIEIFLPSGRLASIGADEVRAIRP